ncbi:MAG TPA: VOC family protein [Armatimonadota bacterium]|jgi:uncharacterized glyoxalase superfamily protein PhnB
MSGHVASEGGATSVECIIPILRVRDLAASLNHYETVLGFHRDWGGEPGGIMASVSRDNCGIMLCEGEQGHFGTWVWIGVSDVRPLFQALKAAGAHIAMEPVNFSWALEFRVEDPDGHILRFGSEPDGASPFADRAAGG